MPAFRLPHLALASFLALPLLAACTATESGVDALESVIAEQKRLQDEIVDQQKKRVEAQAFLAEEQRKKQLELIEKNRALFQTTQALAVKPSQLAQPEKLDPAPSRQAETGEKPPVQKASVGGASRSSGNLVLNAQWDCVPSKLKAVVNEVSRRYGTVTVNSTYRSSKRNRRVGGAKGSYHLRCQAVDFRVRGDSRQVLTFLRNHPHVGGFKRYRSGFFHIDTGPRRTWRG